MRTQEEIKEQIQKEMLELGYILIPELDEMEVIEVADIPYDARRAYYQNLSKVALEKEFINHTINTIPMDDKTKQKIINYGSK
jgi:hypothetical protein